MLHRTNTPSVLSSLPIVKEDVVGNFVLPGTILNISLLQSSGGDNAWISATWRLLNKQNLGWKVDFKNKEIITTSYQKFLGRCLDHGCSISGHI